MNAKLIKDVSREAYTRGGSPAAKLSRATKYMAWFRSDGAPFETIADAFALFAAMNGKRVVIDEVQWIPPLLPEGEIQ